MIKEISLVTFVVCLSAAERISNADSPTWNRRTTTEDYSYLGSGRDRSPSSDRDDVNVRPAFGGSVFTTHRPGHVYTHTWERNDGSGSPTRSSYLDRFTTQSPYGSGSSYDRDDTYGSHRTSRRPSFGTVTDVWGDVVSGRDSPYERHTTDRWGHSGSHDHSYDRTTSRYGDYGSRHTTSRWNTGGFGIPTRSWLDRDTDAAHGHGSHGHGSGSRFDRNEAYVRIQAQLVKLTNEKGFSSTGSKCDTFGACDTTCYAFLDTERPNSEFPGSRDVKYWPKVYETDDNNSPASTNAEVNRDVCGVPYREATLRVKCEDRDSLSSSDLINNFDCSITRDPENSETAASWHSGECLAKFLPDKMKLTFRYKIFVVPKMLCDPSIGALQTGTTPRSTTRRSG